MHPAVPKFKVGDEVEFTFCEDGKEPSFVFWLEGNKTGRGTVTNYDTRMICSCTINVTDPPDWRPKEEYFAEWALHSTKPSARPYDASTGLCPDCGSKTTRPVKTIYCTKCGWKMEP